MKAQQKYGTYAVLAAALALSWCAGLGTPARAATCPNEAIRETQTSEALPLGTTNFPDCMALEMVSPPKKSVQLAIAPDFSASGGRVRFISTAALAGTEGLQFAFGDYYVATRGPGGWETAPTSPPAEAEIATGAAKHGGPHVFSPDLGSWLSFGNTYAQQSAGITRFFRGGLDGSFAPVSPLLVSIDDSDTQLNLLNAAIEPLATSADLSTTALRLRFASTYYLPGDPHGIGIQENAPGGDANSYVVRPDASGEPSLQLLGRDKDGTVYGGRCGTRSGGGIGGVRAAGYLNQGAIAADGSQVYFSTRPAQPFDSETGEGPVCDTANPLRIFERTETPAGPEIDELIPGGPAAGDDLFQGASIDRSRVYFTTTRALTGSDGDSGSKCSANVGQSAGCDLYLYDKSRPPAERLTQVSAGGSGDPTPGSGAGVLSSITAISTDGSHAYFVAQGVLTTDPNPGGKSPVAGKPNLYLYDGQLSFVGTLAESDKGDNLWGTERSFVGPITVPKRGEEVGGDGHILVFASSAQLTADDTDSKRDIFRYDADAGTLLRISKAGPGGSESPPADAVAGRLTDAPSYPDEGRWVSEDGETIAFSTGEPLSAEDGDTDANPYLWKEGQLLALPGTEEAPTVSPDGSEVGFASEAPLLATDGDTAEDVYVARVDGGFPNPPTPPACDPLSEGACQGPGSLPATGPAAATATFSGSGNAAQPQPSCRKGKVKKRGKCVARHNKKKRTPHKKGRAGK